MGVDDYKTVYRAIERPRKLRIDSKYGLCFRMALVKLPRLIERSFPPGKHIINFVLESGDLGSGDAKQIFDDAKANGWPDLPGLLGVLSYGNKPDFPGLQVADLIAFGALQAERKGDIDLTHVTDHHTVQDMGRLVRYKSPVLKYEVTPAAMQEVVEHGIAELENRRRHWQESRVSPQSKPGAGESTS